MNWNQIEGKWAQYKGNAKQRWGRLTDDDLTTIRGNREKLAGKLQELYGKSEEEVSREIEAWNSSLH